MKNIICERSELEGKILIFNYERSELRVGEKYVKNFLFFENSSTAKTGFKKVLNSFK